MSGEPERLYLLEELCEMLHTTRVTVLGYVRDDLLRAIKMPGHKGRWLFPASAVEEFLAEGERRAQQVAKNSHDIDLTEPETVSKTC